jgi:hypothetical protein
MPAQTALHAFIEGIGVLGPGLADWPSTASILASAAPYLASATTLPAPQALPPAERRRTGAAVKLALAIGFEATRHAAVDPSTLATVFSTSGGDGVLEYRRQCNGGGKRPMCARCQFWRRAS